jgi:hypothetical protein
VDPNFSSASKTTFSWFDKKMFCQLPNFDPFVNDVKDIVLITILDF